MVSAFKKRFGLDDLEINIAVGGQPQKFAQLKANLSAGVPPALDSLTGSDENVADALGSGYVQNIDNWQLLLAEINPLVRSGTVKPEEISPGLYSGSAFIWGNRAKAIVYNPKLISESDLPRTHLDLAEARYKGKFAVPPWIDEWVTGILVYKDKGKWLETLDQVGKNAMGVFHLNRGLQRLLLGEIAFLPANNYHYYMAKKKDSDAPVGISYWSDYTGISKITFVVPKGSRHPAAATLWNLWMTTPESEAIWQPESLYVNISYGQSDFDKKIRANYAKANTTLLSFFDNEETHKALKWLGGTDEGERYRNDIVKAVTQRRQRKK
jgi:ABC-type Fe3+ transport system substrate-binding protein